MTGDRDARTFKSVKQRPPGVAFEVHERDDVKAAGKSQAESGRRPTLKLDMQAVGLIAGRPEKCRRRLLHRSWYVPAFRASMEQPNESDLEDDATIDAVIAEFGGDARAAIRALLHDIDVLAHDFSSSVSRGFVRHEKTMWLRTISSKALGGDG